MTCCSGCFPFGNSKSLSGRDLINLNVGGATFTLYRATIMAAPEGCVLREMLTNPREDGSIFLDRDSRHFHHVLNFLRDGERFTAPTDETTCRELTREAEVLGLPQLAKALEMPFKGAARPPNEAERLARLDGLNIMHTNEHVHHFDAVTRIVAAILHVPMVLVSLVHEDHQWFKSRCGIDANRTPRDASFCAHGFLPHDPKAASMFVVEDARLDVRFANNPLVIGPPYIVFYAGCPLVTSDGLRLGALCAIDRKPRSLDTMQAQTLINFATITIQEMERSQLMNSEPSSEEPEDMKPEDISFAAGPLRAARMREALGELVILVRMSRTHDDHQILYGNQVWTTSTGLTITPPDQVTGRADITDEQGRKVERTLWDCLQVTSKSVRDITKQIFRACDASEPSCVAFDGELQVGRWHPSNTSTVNVTCRALPLDHPLDANAQNIKAVPQRTGTTPIGCSRTALSIFSGAVFCFVIMRGHDNAWTTMVKSISESKGSDKRRNSKPGPTTMAEFTRGVTDPPRETPRRVGTGLDAVKEVKAPRTPFVDVKLNKLVGAGSFGKVYHGLWMGSPVAVKVLPSSKQRSSKMEPDFEASLSSTISHPNLVQTFKYSTRQLALPDGSLSSDMTETWIVQEWCEKGTLGAYCCKPRYATECLPEVLEILKDISGAGAYLHSRGIIHGDLTANNVLIKSDVSRKGFVCKVCDFGLARILEGDAVDIMTTQLGTVTHMPPELFKLEAHEIRLSTKADVYAAGVLLWQTLTGEIPYAGLAPPQVVMRVVKGKGLQLTQSVPQGLADLFHKCITENPDERPHFDDLLYSLTMLLDEIVGEPVVRGLQTKLHSNKTVAKDSIR